MNKNIVEAQQILYTAISYTANRKYANKLARAAFYLGDQVWSPDVA